MGLTEPSDLAAMRERIVDALVRTATIIGLVAWLLSVVASIVGGVWPLAVADTALYAWLLFVRFAALPAPKRAVHLVLVFEAIGLSMLFALGPFGHGIMWLVGSTVTCGMLLGARHGRWSLLVHLVAMVVVTVLVVVAPATWDLPADALVGWLAFAAGSLCLSASISESLARLLEGLEASHARTVQDAHTRAQLEQQLLRAQKLEAVGTLAGGVAHDFNNLLQPIVSLGEIVREELGPHHPAAADLDDIIDAAQRARALVQQMLQMTRHPDASAPARAPLHLCDVVGAFLALVRASVGQEVHVELERLTTDDVVNGNEQELQRIILNLVKNAAQAQCKRIVIRVAPSSDAPADAVEGGLGFVSLDIEDDGIGMSAATLERIFEPYFTTKPLGEGTGIGLPLARGIARSMGGDVSVTSASGKGTRFRLSFPRIAAPLKAPALEPPPAMRVLVVDDEEAVLRATARVLPRHGFVATAHSDPAAAVAAFEQSPDAFDVVVTDLSMPKLSGIDVVTALRAIRPGFPAVVISGNLTADAESWLRAHGVTIGCKPLGVAEVAALLEEALPSTEWSEADVVSMKPRRRA